MMVENLNRKPQVLNPKTHFVRGPNPTKSPNLEFTTDMWGQNPIPSWQIRGPNSDPCSRTDFRGPNPTLGVRILKVF